MAATIAFILVFLLAKILWGRIVPDLFPGAVDQGLVADSLTWLAALKVPCWRPSWRARRADDHEWLLTEVLAAG